VPTVPSRPPRADGPAQPARPLSTRWWVSDRDGRIVLAQWPNPALAVWLATVVVGWTGLLAIERATTVRHVGRGALLVWALDELARGSSPARRLLGVVVLVAQLVRLFA
jgi:hypothetical protein